MLGNYCMPIVDEAWSEESQDHEKNGFFVVQDDTEVYKTDTTDAIVLNFR